jgi:hypothetical protein
LEYPQVTLEGCRLEPFGVERLIERLTPLDLLQKAAQQLVIAPLKLVKARCQTGDGIRAWSGLYGAARRPVGLFGA